MIKIILIKSSMWRIGKSGAIMSKDMLMKCGLYSSSLFYTKIFSYYFVFLFGILDYILVPMMQKKLTSKKHAANASDFLTISLRSFYMISSDITLERICTV